MDDTAGDMERPRHASLVVAGYGRIVTVGLFNQ
jgi:hypothetical protein